MSLKAFSGSPFVFWYNYKSFHDLQGSTWSDSCLHALFLSFFRLYAVSFSSRCHPPSPFLVNSDSSYTFKESLTQTLSCPFASEHLFVFNYFTTILEYLLFYEYLPPLLDCKLFQNGNWLCFWSPLYAL